MAQGKKISELTEVSSVTDNDEFLFVDKEGSGADSGVGGKTAKIKFSNLKASFGNFGEQGEKGAKGEIGPRGIDGTGTQYWTQSPTNGDAIYYNAGNVGIGTDAPTHHLHLSGDSQVKLKLESTGGDPSIQFTQPDVDDNTTSSSWMVGQSASSNNFFISKYGLAGGYQLVINNEGNVGIGPNGTLPSVTEGSTGYKLVVSDNVSSGTSILLHNSYSEGDHEPQTWRMIADPDRKHFAIGQQSSSFYSRMKLHSGNTGGFTFGDDGNGPKEGFSTIRFPHTGVYPSLDLIRNVVINELDDPTWGGAGTAIQFGALKNDLDENLDAIPGTRGPQTGARIVAGLYPARNARGSSPMQPNIGNNFGKLEIGIKEYDGDGTMVKRMEMHPFGRTDFFCTKNGGAQTTYSSNAYFPSPGVMIRNLGDTTQAKFSGICFQSSGDTGGYATGWIGVVNGVAGQPTGDMVFGTRKEDNSDDAYGERMRLTKDGHVGIGTDAPSSMLEIKTSTIWGTHNNEALTISNFGSSGNIKEQHGLGRIKWVTNEATAASIDAIRTRPEQGNNTDLVFSNNLGGNSEVVAESMRITSNGNVGIGTNDPLNALHIDSTPDKYDHFRSNLFISDDTPYSEDMNGVGGGIALGGYYKSDLPATTFGAIYTYKTTDGNADAKLCLVARKEGRNFDQSAVGIQLDGPSNHTSFVGNVSVNNSDHDIQDSSHLDIWAKHNSVASRTWSFNSPDMGFHPVTSYHFFTLRIPANSNENSWGVLDIDMQLLSQQSAGHTCQVVKSAKIFINRPTQNTHNNNSPVTVRIDNIGDNFTNEDGTAASVDSFDLSYEVTGSGATEPQYVKLLVNTTGDTAGTVGISGIASFKGSDNIIRT